MATRIAFIDSRVSDYQTLIAGLPAGTDYFVLDPEQNGLTQILSFLQGYQQLDAIDIFSHGSPGTLSLGSTVLNGENLSDYAALLADLGSHLTASGDLLIYGCDVAQGEVGQAFIAQLAQLTGADVAASTDLTGAAALGGDWQLEAQTGDIDEVSGPFSYNGVLAVITGTASNDTLDGTVNDDILYGLDGQDTLNGLGGNDTLEGGNGYDQLYGGQGDDLLIGGTAGTNADDTGNTLYGEGGNDTLIGGDVAGVRDTLGGGDDNDTLSGLGGNDDLYGGAGNDTLDGGAGDDYLTDHSGNNAINGGAGNDQFFVYSYNAADSSTLTGGAGVDRYILEPSNNGTLTVTDFTAGAGGDVIDISTLLNASSGYASGNPFDASLGYLRLVQNGADVQLQWDANGTAGGANWKTVLTLQNIDLNSTPLTAQNFVPNLGTLPINYAPSLSGTAATLAAGVENTAYTVTTAELLQGWTDVENSPLSVLNVSANHGSVLNNGNGTWTVTPTANYNGAVTLSYSVSDGVNSTNATLGFSLEAVIAPTADAFSATGPEDSTVMITLSGSDPDGTVASFKMISLPANGTLYSDAGLLTPVAVNTVIAAAGNTATLYFLPDANWNGTTGFTYAAIDNGNAQSQANASVDITVVPMNEGATVTLFSAYDYLNGQELWVTDGTAAGTMLLKDIVAGSGSSSPSDFTALGNGQVVFTATDAVHGKELWVSDGTAPGTVLLKDINAGSGTSYPEFITALGNGQVVFTSDDGVNGREPWITDGTPEGTVLLKDINAGSGGSNPYGFTALGNGQVVFSAYDNVNGAELWVTNGTAAGTVLLKDILTGDFGSAPTGFTALGNGQVVFSAYDDVNGTELWVTNGTAAGTGLLKDIVAGSGGSNPSGFTALGNGQVVFSADDGVNGQELWVSDGTATGTVLLKDIFTGGISSDPSGFTALGNGQVVFKVNDGVNGFELWVTNGTAAGTVLLKDIFPGGVGSDPYGFTALGNGQVMFSAYDAADGSELWITDGTEAGTKL